VSFNTLPPWKTLDENGNVGGIDIEFLHLVAKRMHLDVEFVHLPFKRGLKMLEHGNVDLMVGVLHRPEREAFAHFLMPPYKNKTNKALYVLRGNEDWITEYEDMHSLRIGTQLGGKYFPRFDTDKSISKSSVKSFELNIKMLLAGRIDAFITTEAAGDYRLARSGLADSITKARYVYHNEQDVCMVLSKRSSHAPRLAEFNNVMRELVEGGMFEQVKKEYISRVENVVSQ